MDKIVAMGVAVGVRLLRRNLSNQFKSNKIIFFLLMWDFVKILFDFCAARRTPSRCDGSRLPLTYS